MQAGCIYSHRFAVNLDIVDIVDDLLSDGTCESRKVGKIQVLYLSNINVQPSEKETGL